MYFAIGHKSVSICAVLGFPIQVGLLERVAEEAELDSASVCQLCAVCRSGNDIDRTFS